MTRQVVKRCSKCRLDKPLVCFHKATKSKDGLFPRCMDCVADYYKANRDSIAKRNFRYRYGVSNAFVEEQAKLQKYICPICLEPKPLVVDHDHKTKEFRGLLCRTCNCLLGHAKDNPELLEQAAHYLRRDI